MQALVILSCQHACRQSITSTGIFKWANGLCMAQGNDNICGIAGVLNLNVYSGFTKFSIL